MDHAGWRPDATNVGVVSRSEPPAAGSGADPAGRGLERPPSWLGAPGYTPHPELPPHAPMPGAPPYPGRAAEPPRSVGRTGTGFPRVLVAAAVWAAVHVLLVALASELVSPVRFGAGLAVSTLLAALAGWLWARRRRWPFWLLVLAVAPVFWVLRAVVALPLG